MFSHLQLRDFFAAPALAGYIAAHAGDGVSLPTKAIAAEWSYRMASAMLAERQKQESASPSPAAKPETPTANPAA